MNLASCPGRPLHGFPPGAEAGQVLSVEEVFRDRPDATQLMRQGLFAHFTKVTMVAQHCACSAAVVRASVCCSEPALNKPEDVECIYCLELWDLNSDGVCCQGGPIF